MSIKFKFLLVFMACVTAILAISNMVIYEVAQNTLLNSSVKRVVKNSQQFDDMLKGVSVRSSYAEDIMAENLRVDSIYTEKLLDPDAAKVTNDQLVAISKHLGISDITLFQVDPSGKFFVGVKSSDPNELGITTKDWDFWNTACLQLYYNRKITVSQGQKMQNYWAGPIGISSSNSKTVDKWGYYYDGKTNYIIDPYIQDADIVKFQQSMGPDSIMKYLSTQSDLEVTGFNPKTFGYPPILTKSDHQGGAPFVSLENRAIQFGQYTYKDPKDIETVRQAYQTGKPMYFVTTVNGVKVDKTFVPVKDPSTGNPYIIGIVKSYSTIEKDLTSYLEYSLLTSGIMWVLMAVISYLVADRVTKPISKISERIQQLSNRNFTQSNSNVHNARGELGELANNLNLMSRSFHLYTSGLRTSIANERSNTMLFLGMVLKGLVHELRNPITAMQSFTQVLPALLQKEQNPKAVQTVHQMSSLSQNLLRLVEEVSALIRQGDAKLSESDICASVQDAIKAVQPIASEMDCNIKLADCSSMYAMFDQKKVKDVLIRLLKSGMYAMQDLPKKEIFISLYEKEHEVIIGLYRTGKIPEERRNVVFTKPYKTNEDPLGLRFITCDFVLRSCGGTICVGQDTAYDTAMLISLPKCEPLSDQESQPYQAAPSN